MADTGGNQVCVNLVGIISGSILGTLAVCTIITGIVIHFICRKHRQKKIKYLGEVTSAAAATSTATATVTSLTTTVTTNSIRGQPWCID